MRCTVLEFTSNLAAVLRTLMPPARAVFIRQPVFEFVKGRQATRNADLAWVLKADLENGTSKGLLCPSPGSRRWLESEDVQDQGARE